jgi:tetratricopeptide (TPR) repeat protein
VLHRVKALIAQQQAAPDQAAQHFEQSLQLLSAHGYKPGLARTYQALGQFKPAQGQAAEARDALQKAADLFREMGFTLELNQTLRLIEKINRLDQQFLARAGGAAESAASDLGGRQGRDGARGS